MVKLSEVSVLSSFSSLVWVLGGNWVLRYFFRVRCIFRLDVVSC